MDDVPALADDPEVREVGAAAVLRVSQLVCAGALGCDGSKGVR